MLFGNLTGLASISTRKPMVGKLLETEFANWTILVIAHRLQTIVDFDRVLVLEDGRVAECGRPQDLLEKGAVGVADVI